jgi:hypothetical protein
MRILKETKNKITKKVPNASRKATTYHIPSLGSTSLLQISLLQLDATVIVHFAYLTLNWLKHRLPMCTLLASVVDPE